MKTHDISEAYCEIMSVFFRSPVIFGLSTNLSDIIEHAREIGVKDEESLKTLMSSQVSEFEKKHPEIKDRIRDFPMKMLPNSAWAIILRGMRLSDGDRMIFLLRIIGEMA